MRIASIATLAFVAITGTAPAMAAESVAHEASPGIYVKITGANQGVITSGTARNLGLRDVIAATGFKYEVSTPVNAQGTFGRPSRTPIVISKAIDATTPALLHAWLTGEALKSVSITLELKEPRFMQAAAHTPPTATVTLTNARVIDVRQVQGEFAQANGEGSGAPREEVSFAYDKLEVSQSENKTTTFTDEVLHN